MANPDPSPETRFKPGNNANPGGKTSEQKQKEMAAAQMAADLRHDILSAMTEKVKSGADPLELIDANTLKLFKDSEDRAHGTPKSTLAGDPEAPVLTEIVTRVVYPDRQSTD